VPNGPSERAFGAEISESGEANAGKSGVFQASGVNCEDRNGPIEDMVSLLAGLFGRRDVYIMALAERGAERAWLKTDRRGVRWLD
jgi:hypothetical protein